MKKMQRDKLLNYIMYFIIIFLVGSFVGWCYESIFYTITEKVFTNRGILYGPWLPIYGTGAILIVFLKPLKKHPILLFILIMLVTGVLEYAIGYVDEVIFNIKLWDYTGLFLNIDGYVCIRSVITFAVGGIILIYLVEPFIEKLMKNIEQKKILIFCIVFIIVFVIDKILSTLYRTPITY